MIEIKKFTATDKEFEELARIDNLVNHDCICHPDDDKDDWKLRDKSLIRDRLLLYNNDVLIGVLYYSQGRNENNRTCFYTLHLDPNYNQKGYRKLLYNKMLLKAFPELFKMPTKVNLGLGLDANKISILSRA